jgi:biotin carboxyl carrier protein
MTISIPKNSNGLLGALPARDDDPFDGTPHGEPLAIAERLVVSPTWGRLRTVAVEEGQSLDAGSVIGVIREAGEEHPLVCRSASVFVAWLAIENERVPPGRALARVRPLDQPARNGRHPSTEVESE